MKLYTEEELKKFMQKHVILDELTLSLLTPIELPSDEYIEQEANLITDLSMRSVYILGSKSMRDKIQGGNNEQP